MNKTKEKQIFSFIYLNNEELEGYAYFDYSTCDEEIDYSFKYFITNTLQKFDASEIQTSCLQRLTERFLESFY